MDFMEKLQQSLSRGVSTSRELFGKAKDKARDLGEKGLLHLELQQLERQTEGLVGQLGARVYEELVTKGGMGVSLETQGIKHLVDEIGRVKGQIEEREEALRRLGKGE